MFLVTDLPPVPAYEMVLPATPKPAIGFVLASTAAHLKTIKQCPAHQHFVKGVCTPYLPWSAMWEKAKT
jgi:hypothetical protein